LISVDDVSVSLDGKKILDAVSFRIDGGESVALLGSNGAGKSTLIRSIAGMLPLTSGAVTIASQEVSTQYRDEEWRQSIGFIPQNSPLVETASVLTNVVHGFAGARGDWRCCLQSLARGWMRERAMQILDSVGLADKASKQAGQLSGGEVQRCSIARALVREPKLVLADEPTASLDPATRQEIHQLLRDTAAQAGSALLVSSHLVEEVRDFFQRLIALRDGSVILDRSTADVSPDELNDIYKTGASRER